MGRCEIIQNYQSLFFPTSVVMSSGCSRGDAILGQCWREKACKMGVTKLEEDKMQSCRTTDRERSSEGSRGEGSKIQTKYRDGPQHVAMALC